MYFCCFYSILFQLIFVIFIVKRLRSISIDRLIDNCERRHFSCVLFDAYACYTTSALTY